MDTASQHLREKTWLLHEKYEGATTESYMADCARLDAGEPLAYIIGTVPFLNVTIHLDSHPLIPRPETEHWTFKAITEMHHHDPAKDDHGAIPLRVLDLCAGSGCIGVSVLAGVPNAQVDFIELDTAHHPTIKKNLQKNNLDISRARIFGGDLFEQTADTYDFILTNPPYINPVLSDRVAPSVTEHEPHQALFGGKDGMEYIARIITEAPAHLTEHGVLYIEHEPEQAAAIASLAALHFTSCAAHEDQYGDLRFTRCIR